MKGAGDGAQDPGGTAPGPVASTAHAPAGGGAQAPGSRPAGIVLEVVIEIPRWSCLKRGSTGELDFLSPLPCPYNYGSVPAWLGGEGDLLDALVLGPRLPRGTRVLVEALGAVGLRDRGLYDDKLICRPLERPGGTSHPGRTRHGRGGPGSRPEVAPAGLDPLLVPPVDPPIDPGVRERVLRFLHLYALCKGWLNRLRGAPGETRCTGWGSVRDAMARATPRPPGWGGPRVGYSGPARV